MTITEQHRALGDWELNLVPETPGSIYTALGWYGHIIITKARYPLERFDLNPAGVKPLLAESIYTGVLLRRSRSADDAVKIGGPGLAHWLGDGDDQGDLITTTGPGTKTFVNWVTTLRPVSLAAGSITAAGAGAFARSYVRDSRRKALDEVCDFYSGEWRITPDGKLNAGTRTTLFGSTPKAIVLPTVSTTADDPASITALNNPSVAVAGDADDYLSSMFSVVNSGATQGTATITGPFYVDLNGNLANIAGVIELPEADLTSANAVAAAELVRSGISRVITVTCDEVALTSTVPVGSDVWVYDPLRDLSDTANVMHYAGRDVFPVKVRLLSATWPVVSGFGVYYRAADAPGTMTDLTPYVVWETGDRTRLGLDALRTAPTVVTEQRRKKRRKHK